MGIFDKIKDLAGQDKVSEGIDSVIDKAGDLIDSATSGKFADKIDQVQGMAKEKIDEAMNAVMGNDSEAPVEEVTEAPVETIEEVATDAIDETF
ncbi:MAG: antitoxin [Propionibacteriaceae bacterium]